MSTQLLVKRDYSSPVDGAGRWTVVLLSAQTVAGEVGP
jgi:hypothetical protein